MDQNQIVEALLAAARGVVAARFGERADELWDNLEFGLRIAAENLVDQAVGRQRRERVRKAYEAFAPISRGAFLPANFPLEVEPSADKPAWFPIVLNSILPPFVLADFVDESQEEARNQILRTPVNQGDYDEWLRSAGKVNEYERLITGLVGKWSDKKEPYLLRNAMFLLHLLSGEVAKRLDQLRNTTPVKIADDLKKGKWPTHGSEIDRIALRIFLSEKLGREVQETYPLLHEAAEEYERKSANAPSSWAERTADAKRRAEVVNEKVRFLRENAPMVAYDLEELELPSPYLTKAEMDEYEERLKAAEESAFRSTRAQPQAAKAVERTDDADLDIEAGNAPPEAEEPEEPEEPEARGGKRAAKGATGSVSDVREHFGVAAIVRRMGTNQITVQELREAYRAFAARKDEVIEALEALPKVALERYALRKDLPKQRLVESAFDQMLEAYIPQAAFRSFVVGPRMPSRQQVVESTLETATEKDLKEYAERKERNLRSLRERLERLKNPKTYDDFVELIDVLKGSANLSPELRRRFDELVADKAKTDAIAELEKKEKERAERAAKFASARPEGSAATTKAKVIAGRHTKKNTPIWTVVLEERLGSEEFGDAKQRAKRFDGYYSSYRGGGAVPGFVFESEERANAFAATYGGNPAEPKAAPEAVPEAVPEADREEPRTIYGRKPERLRELAESMAQRANESLGVERQDNTLRRARMASQAEEAARAELARADTLRAIAEGVESGELQHLWVVGTTAHADLLDSALLQARHRRYRQERTNEWGWGDSYESWKERVGPIGEGEMPYVEFPHPQVRKRYAEELAGKFAKERGAIQASARVLKVVGAMKDQEVFTPNERTVEALDTLAEIGLQNRETKYAAQNVKESLAASKRASEGMGLRSVNHLRAVLREYLAVRKQPKGQSTVAQLKRQIVGANIPGYFPTPPSAAARVVELAKIEPGQLVLEPSAGSGALADAAKAAGGEVRVVERNLSLREILQAKGHPLVGNDTMDVRGAYDRIVMNPPFEDSQDIEHVLHAYENQLAPGGRLVAIVSRGALTRSDKKAQGFRDWIASVGAETENLPDGTFASKESERKTGVATSIVIADKPKPGSAQK